MASTTIPNLRQMMVEKQATWSELSRQSGLSEIVIYNAIRGMAIRQTSADVIFQTLAERDFSYKTKRDYYAKIKN